MTDKKMDRYEGAMIGVAVGDALGAPLEFMGAGEIRRKHGEPVREMIGGGWLDVDPGEVTDDTQMTLAVAEGIAMNKPGVLYQIGENFLTWYGTHPKDIGGTCAAVLGEMSQNHPTSGDDWRMAAMRLNKSTSGRTAGNGALMRTIYPALWYKDEDTAAKMAVEIGQMTHCHRDSDRTIRIYTKAVCRIANSEMSAEEAREWLDNLMTVTEDTLVSPTGYCIDSLKCALQSVRRTDSFEDALVDAVNRGGDADTIGAITGGLAGAVYGASGIPLRWQNALSNQPNRKTVRMFQGSADATTQGNANTLLLRLIDLAHIAYGREKA